MPVRRVCKLFSIASWSSSGYRRSLQRTSLALPFPRASSGAGTIGRRPLSVAEATRARFGWPLRVIEHCADDPPIEQPEAFLEALRAALESLTEERGAT